MQETKLVLVSKRTSIESVYAEIEEVLWVEWRWHEDLSLSLTKGTPLGVDKSSGTTVP